MKIVLKIAGCHTCFIAGFLVYDNTIGPIACLSLLIAGIAALSIRIKTLERG